MSDFDFVDDVNILIYDKTTKENCRTLEDFHEKYAQWARRHEVVFASTKYELIYLIRNLKKFNMKVCIKIERECIASKTDIRMLRLQIDIKLKWEFHVRKIQKKMTRQSMTLLKISIFIWDVTFAKIRQMYIVVIRSAMIYESSVWHISSKLKDTSKSLINQMSIMQNKCLRVINDVYRVTLVRDLKVKTQIALMRIHLNQLQAQIRCRLLNDDQAL